MKDKLKDVKKVNLSNNEYTRLIMKTFNHVGNDLKDLKLKTLKGRDSMSLLKVISTLVLPRYSVTFQNNQLLNEEGAGRTLSQQD